MDVVFGSVSTKAIAEEFEKQFGIKLDKRKMGLEEPIRGLGMARIPIQITSRSCCNNLCSN